jgi:CRP-like cAMP-binding protein
MHEQLKRYLSLNISITDGRLDEIAKQFKPLTVKRNTVLLSQGENCNRLYFVNKGCIRTYYITEQGHEKTRFIAFEGMIITSLSGFISQQPSFEFVGTLEDSELLCISHDKFYTLVNEFPEWRKFYLKLLELAYIYQNKKIEELVTLSAGERYESLMKEHPVYIQRLSNKILASYLDISQETLSRLKSK